MSKASGDPPLSQKGAKTRWTNPEGQAWPTHKSVSPRLQETRASLDELILERFPKAHKTFEYNMYGWKIRRPVEISKWKGTIDPNWIHIYVAEQKAGITIHVWNPYDPEAIKKHELAKAGFKPMVGCIQYNRKGAVPVEALKPMLDEMQATLTE